MNRNLIDITNHPDLPNVTRKVEVIQAINNYKKNIIDLRLEVHHYVDGAEVKYFPKSADLIGDNESKVNPINGAVVFPDVETGKYPEGSIGEYDYLYYIVNTAKAYTQVELEDIYVQLRVAVINKKLYS